MANTYSIHNQLTGLIESANTYSDALVLQARIKSEWEISQELFAITILVTNEDGSITQSRVDSNGDPLIIT